MQKLIAIACYGATGVHAVTQEMASRGVVVRKRSFAQCDSARRGPRGRRVIQGRALWKRATEGTCRLTSCTRLVKQNRRPVLGFGLPPVHASLEHDSLVSAHLERHLCRILLKNRPYCLHRAHSPLLTTPGWLGRCSLRGHAGTTHGLVMQGSHDGAGLVCVARSSGAVGALCCRVVRV